MWKMVSKKILTWFESTQIWYILIRKKSGQLIQRSKFDNSTAARAHKRIVRAELHPEMPQHLGVHTCQRGHQNGRQDAIRADAPERGRQVCGGVVSAHVGLLAARLNDALARQLHGPTLADTQLVGGAHRLRLRMRGSPRRCPRVSPRRAAPQTQAGVQHRRGTVAHRLPEQQCAVGIAKDCHRVASAGRLHDHGLHNRSQAFASHEEAVESDHAKLSWAARVGDEAGRSVHMAAIAWGQTRRFGQHS